MFFFIFISKNTNADGFLFFDFVIFNGNFMSLKTRFLENSLSASVILAGLPSGGFKCLTILHLKDLLSSVF